MAASLRLESYVTDRLPPVGKEARGCSSYSPPCIVPEGCPDVTRRNTRKRRETGPGTGYVLGKCRPGLLEHGGSKPPGTTEMPISRRLIKKVLCVHWKTRKLLDRMRTLYTALSNDLLEILLDREKTFRRMFMTRQHLRVGCALGHTVSPREKSQEIGNGGDSWDGNWEAGAQGSLCSLLCILYCPPQGSTLHSETNKFHFRVYIQTGGKAGTQPDTCTPGSTAASLSVAKGGDHPHGHR